MRLECLKDDLGHFMVQGSFAPSRASWYSGNGLENFRLRFTASCHELRFIDVVSGLVPQFAFAIVETGFAVSRGPRAAPKRASRAALVVTVSRRAIAVTLSAITVLRGARCPVALLREAFTGPAVAASTFVVARTPRVVGARIQCKAFTPRETAVVALTDSTAHGVGPTHRPVGHLRAVIVTSESGVPVLAALSLRTRRSRRATAGFAFTFGVAHTRVTLFLGELRDAGAFLRADLTDTYGEGDSAIAWAILTFALSVRPTLCAIGKGSTVVAPGIHG